MTHTIRRLGLVVAVAAGAALLAPGHAQALPAGAPKVGMVCSGGTLAAGVRTFHLKASTGYIQTPDGNSVYMWSYADSDDPNPTLAAFQSPGPVLCANEGETVSIILTNNLPESSSIVFPGQDGAVTATGGAAGLLTTEATASGGTVTYTFTAGSPGTYLYESGSDIAKQVEMGLYGALIVRPSTANQAYDSAGTAFDPSREYLLLLADIDPFLHHAVEVGSTYDFNSRNNRYFTINGRSFPDTIQDNGSPLVPTQPYGSLVRIQPNVSASSAPALVRMINVGVDNHPFHPHGNHTRQIAQDGRLLLSPGGASASTEHFGETIGAGQTQDFLLRWDNKATDSSGASFNDDWSPSTNPLPVPQPNYLNLTFKDGNTYYSGSPYMGYKGTLPTGTVQQNICGEWYFPFHSHALNEFTNFDQGFGGMGTLLRVDPQGGCFASTTSTTIVGGTLKSGSVSALAADDSTYYQVNPKTTTLSGAVNTTGSPTGSLAGAITSTTGTTLTVSSNAGWPAAPYYIRVDNEILQVTAKNFTGTTWTVSRGQLGSTAATHASGAGVTYVIGVASAAGFPTSGAYYVRVDNEVLQVTGGQGTRAWTVARGQLGSTAAAHLASATITALANDWYAGFSAVPAGSANIKITYKGENCQTTTATTCTAFTGAPVPQQTVKICNWTISGAAGCATATSNGWVTLPAPQGIDVGSTDVSTTWTLPGVNNQYIGTGAYSGQVRVLVHTQRWRPTNPTAFSTWGNLMKIVYDAP